MSACVDHGQIGNSDGYGRTSRKIRGAWKTVGSHVAALMDATGEEPNGRQALHTCDNPRCHNPEHLYWGTQKQNMQDMVLRGRRGARGRPGKLSDEQVRIIRSTLGYKEIIANFGISRAAIHNVRSGRSYKEVQ